VAALAWTLVAVTAAMVALDAYAIRKVFMSPFYDPGQRWAQAALILLFPLGGACLTLYLCRDDMPMFQPTPVDHAIDGDSSHVDGAHHD
jgi:hypothetical protein